MPQRISLAELRRRAVTFPGPNVPLAGLRIALEAVEEGLTHACEQATLRLRAQQKNESKFLHPDDSAQEFYELEVTVEQTLPRIFRGGFILMLWTVFEVVTKRMAEYVCCEREEPEKPSFKFRKGENFLDALERVYKVNLKIEAFPDATIRRQLDLLRQVRNAIVHHNGNVKALPDEIRKKDQRGTPYSGLRIFTDCHDEFFIPTADFLNLNLSLVDTYLTSLATRVYATVHPIPLENHAA